MHTLWIPHDGGEMPEELNGAPFEAKFRNGKTAKYGKNARARWVFHPNSTTPFDIVAYRLLV